MLAAQPNKNHEQRLTPVDKITQNLPHQQLETDSMRSHTHVI